jgi:hypothetical protein
MSMRLRCNCRNLFTNVQRHGVITLDGRDAIGAEYGRFDEMILRIDTRLPARFHKPIYGPSICQCTALRQSRDANANVTFLPLAAAHTE